jgi:salicylate hydroxylase
MATTRDAGPVLISGGGIGGLACALGFARRGFRSVVLEQAREFGEVGVGLQVAPNALSALDALGVGKEVKRDLFLIERMLLRDSVSGEPVVDIPCGPGFVRRFGNPYAVAHRADVHGALLAACQADGRVSLRTRSRVIAYEQDGAGVRVELESGERLSGGALIGADGVYSRVRQIMLGDGGPAGSGFIIYRAVIPAERMPRDLQHPYPTIWAGPDNHIIYYPVRDWKLFNFAATVRTGQTEVDETTPAEPAEALALFPHNSPESLRVMRIPDSFRRYVIRHREPGERWVDGSVALLGDSAHAMVQFIAQGAAMALEDAVCLALCVDEAGGDFPAAFLRYQDLRLVRASRVQISSLMMDRILHPSGVARRVRNSLFEGRSTEESYERLAWLYVPPDYVSRFASLGPI